MPPVFASGAPPLVTLPLRVSPFPKSRSRASWSPSPPMVIRPRAWRPRQRDAGPQRPFTGNQAIDAVVPLRVDGAAAVGPGRTAPQHLHMADLIALQSE